MNNSIKYYIQWDECKEVEKVSVRAQCLTRKFLLDGSALIPMRL